MAVNNNVDTKPYQYQPSTAAAAIFAVLFGAMTLLHLCNLFRTRTWPLIPFVIGGIMETIGYVGRIINSRQPYDQWSEGIFIMQNILLIIAPTLFAASIYMVLGRIILLTNGQAHAIIGVRWITGMFVAGDIISFFTQAAGGGIMGSGHGAHLRTGEDVITVGIGLQIVFFGFFVFTAGMFNMRMRRVPTARVKTQSVPWQEHLKALYIMSGLILVRSIFRVVEFIQGNDGYLTAHEWFLYVFDGLLMLGVMLVWSLRHPSIVYAMLKGKGGNAVHKVVRVSRVELLPSEQQMEAM